MLLYICLAALALIVVGPISVHHFGLERTVIAATFASLCLYPQLLGHRTLDGHVGMAPTSPEVRTFTVILAPFLLVGIFGHSRKYRLHPAFLLLAAWIATGMALWWHDGNLQWAGIVQLCLAPAAWTAGKIFASWHDRVPGVADLLVNMVGLIILIEGVVSVMQRAGIPINSLPPGDAAQLGHRTNGTLNHPDNLGKALVLLLALLLVLSRSGRAGNNRRVSTIFIAAVVPLGLAEGRANFIAYVALAVIWYVLLPRDGRTVMQSRILLGVIMVSGVGMIATLDRFSSDPNGGVRPQLLNIAYEVLPKYAGRGMGPNSYTDTVGPIYQVYVPVHNSFFLATAELGVVGSFLLFAPPLFATTRAVFRFRLRTGRGDGARALLGLAPGVALIGWTGWGMIATSILPLWFLTTSFLNSVGSERELPTAGAAGEDEAFFQATLSLRAEPAFARSSV
jgi:hypothetical protein